MSICIRTTEENSQITRVESPRPPNDEEDAEKHEEGLPTTDHKSAFRSLGFLDQFLALWILLAMIVGIILGNFVPETSPALQRGKFVGVSIPIGALDVLQHWTYPLG